MSSSTEEGTTKKRKSTPSSSSGGSTKKKKAVNLAKKLASLEKDQIIEIITEKLQTQFPDKYDSLEADVLQICPDQNIDHVIEDIKKELSNVNKAFPYSRYGSNRDNYAFKRVKPCLTALKKTITEKSKEVKDGQNWHLMCSYLNKVMVVVEDIPDFDDEKNNKPKKDLFKHCAKNYVAMLKARDCDLTNDEIESISSVIDSTSQSENTDFADVIERVNKKKTN
ncbi:hypothetical protein ABK040_001241 [Willaertia magna]